MTSPTPTPSQIRGSLIPTLPEEAAPGQENFSVLYAGFPKSGKTHCMGTWPDPLVLYTDQNTATMRKHGIPYVPIRDWPTFKNHIVPALKQRSWFSEAEDGEVSLVPFPFRTIVLDTASTLGDYLLDYLTNVKHLDQSKNSYEIWQVYLSEFMPAMRALVDMATAKPDQPSANVLVGCHLHDVLNDGGRVTKTKLDISGRSSAHLPKLFDTVLLCRSEIERTSTSSGPSRITGSKYYTYTLNPTQLLEFIGDGVGGAKYKTLAPTTGGTYPELMKAWGVSVGE